MACWFRRPSFAHLGVLQLAKAPPNELALIQQLLVFLVFECELLSLGRVLHGVLAASPSWKALVTYTAHEAFQGSGSLLVACPIWAGLSVQVADCGLYL